MIDKKVVGFLINKVKYHEDDAIVTILTKEGEVSFLGRGVYKLTSKNGPSLNFCLLGEYELSSKLESSHNTLKKGTIIKSYYKIHDDMIAMSTYVYICELIMRLDNKKDYYDLALYCFDSLEANVNPQAVLLYFLKEAVNKLGFKPLLNGCSICQKKTNLISFSLKDGGFICCDCFNQSWHEKYEKNELKFIDDLYKNNIEIQPIYFVRLIKMYHKFMKEEIGINCPSLGLVL